MDDARRARRDAEKAALVALNGTLVSAAGALGVARAEREHAKATVETARVRATEILEAAHYEAATVVAAAEDEARVASEAYSASWYAAKEAGWSPAQLRSMGYVKPSIVRR